MERETPVFNYITHRINAGDLEAVTWHPMDLLIVEEADAPLQARLLDLQIREYEGKIYHTSTEPELAYVGDLNPLILDGIKQESSSHLIIGTKLYRLGNPRWANRRQGMELSRSSMGPLWSEMDWDLVLAQLDATSDDAATEFNPIQFSKAFLEKDRANA